MARYIGSICKLSRRVGVDLNLKSRGSRDVSSKCKLKIFPGQHGSKRKKISGNYSTQLNSKRIIKYTYGVLEKQFKRYYSVISKKRGIKGLLLLKLLESRLDNVVYRMGFASTRAEARQLVSHKSIIVKESNSYEKVINIPSYIVKTGCLIKVSDKSKNQVRIQHALSCAEKTGFANWVSVDIKNMTGLFVKIPDRKDLPIDFNEQMVIESYSK